LRVGSALGATIGDTNAEGADEENGQAVNAGGRAIGATNDDMIGSTKLAIGAIVRLRWFLTLFVATVCADPRPCKMRGVRRCRTGK
jgi:hypothetical protein